MKIGVIGHSGCLGGTLTRFLRTQHCELVSVGRDTLDISPSQNLQVVGGRLTRQFGLDCDYVINCAGAIKPIFAANPIDLSGPIFVNAVFPHLLTQWGELTSTKVILINSDCCFSGKQGNYAENSSHDALDDYGKSKSLGISPYAMNLLTSIIGPEYGGKKRSLFEWMRSQRGREVNGFINHWWNGLTTLELSSSIWRIIQDGLWRKGTYHLFSDALSKYELLCLINEIYDLRIQINPIDASTNVDRTLMSNYQLCSSLKIKDMRGMIEEMRNFH